MKNKATYEVLGDIPGFIARKDGFLFNPVARDPIIEIKELESRLIYKYTKPKYVKSFFDEGKLRLNLVKTFTDIHDDARVDGEEGKLEFDLPENGKFVGKDGIALGLTNPDPNVKRNGPPRIKTDAYGMLFCTSKKKSDELKMKFGGAGFVIKNIPKFTEIMRNKIEEQHPLHDVIVDEVKYSDEKLPPNSLFDPRAVIFQKNTRYSEEEEWRFFFSPRQAVHFPVDIVCKEAIPYCDPI